MPYIQSELRSHIDGEIDALIKKCFDSVKLDEGPGPVIPGVANYAISRLLNGLFFEQSVRYHSIAAAVGCVECVKQELYDRVARSYENLAIKKNGDIVDYQEFDRDMNDRRYL